MQGDGEMAELAQVVDFQAARERRQVRAHEAWVGKRAVALHFGVSTRTIENWVRDHGMPHVKRFEHGHVKFRLGECDDWFRGRAS